MLDCYSIPANFSQLTQKGSRLEKVSLHESVRQHILLMLISQWGSLRHDPAFGCAFWEHDFESSAALEQKRHGFEKLVKEMILERELRLDPQGLKVTFKVFNTPIPSVRGKKMLSLKKRIEMQVSGKLLETNKPFQPEPFLLYFSPVAIEAKSRR